MWSSRVARPECSGASSVACSSSHPSNDARNSSRSTSAPPHAATPRGGKEYQLSIRFGRGGEQVHEREVLFTGVGGQGVQIVAKALAMAAVAEGREACSFSEYSGGMRGSKTNAELTVGDARCGRCRSCVDAWSAFVMDQAFWETIRPKLAAGRSLVVVNSSLFHLPVDGRRRPRGRGAGERHRGAARQPDERGLRPRRRVRRRSAGSSPSRRSSPRCVELVPAVPGPAHRRQRARHRRGRGRRAGAGCSRRGPDVAAP